MYVLSIIQIVAVIRKYQCLPLSTRDDKTRKLKYLVEITATSWIQFSIGRVFAYLAVGIVEPTVPMYQAELAPAPLRGFFAGNVQVLVHLGSIWGAGMSRAYASETQKQGWMIPVAMQMIPAILLLVGVPFCVESPRWLISKSRKVSHCNDLRLALYNHLTPRHT